MSFPPPAPPAFMSGSLVTSTATFVNAAGVPTDPTLITLMYRKGFGSVTTVVYPSSPIVRNDEGVYAAALDSSGWAGPDNQLWTVQWLGEGDVQAIGVSYWTIIPPVLAA